MVTDLVEIRRLGAAKAAENIEFRRYLSAHHQPLEPFQKLAAGIECQVDCMACANCCRHSIVSVSQTEVEAIARFLGLEPAEAARRYTEPNPEGPATSVLRSTREGCIFLDGTLCTVYASRPRACREFPHIGLGVHSLGARVSSLCRWAALCPIVYNALEEYKRVVGYRARGAAGG